MTSDGPEPGSPPTPAQQWAASQIRNAGLTLGSAEKVIAEAAGHLGDAIADGIEAGLGEAEIRDAASFELGGLGRGVLASVLHNQVEKAEAARSRAKAKAEARAAKAG